jgi:hypothetical protein
MIIVLVTVTVVSVFVGLGIASCALEIVRFFRGAK